MNPMYATIYFTKELDYVDRSLESLGVRSKGVLH
jgi:hypothetical protein